MLNMDPSKTSYASSAALDFLTQDTSLPLNPQFHHLLLIELGITDIQAWLATHSDPDTLTYDQVLLDQTLKNGRKVPTRKSHSWKAKAHGLKLQLQKSLPRFFQAHGHFIARELLQESSPNSSQDIVSEVT